MRNGSHNSWFIRLESPLLPQLFTAVLHTLRVQCLYSRAMFCRTGSASTENGIIKLHDLTEYYTEAGESNWNKRYFMKPFI
jgi:hypothetical protein